ncbi:MAG: hypothetical protein ACE5KF_00610 [Kiloniellaceae bacterium]
MRRNLITLVLLAALAACTQYSLVEVKRQTIGGVYSVEPQIAWSKTTEGKVELWTVDGPWLEALRFYKGLGDGDTLDKAPGRKKSPTYRAGMKASEVMEFVVDSLARSGASNVQARNLRPTRFGTVPGFRFDLIFLSPEGLEIDGTVAGAVVAEKLHMIMYTGARAHYYPKYKDDVERIIDSIQMI